MHFTASTVTIPANTFLPSAAHQHHSPERAAWVSSRTGKAFPFLSLGLQSDFQQKDPATNRSNTTENIKVSVFKNIKFNTKKDVFVIK